jgi:hypothetical protein
MDIETSVNNRLLLQARYKLGLEFLKAHGIKIEGVSMNKYSVAFIALCVLAFSASFAFCAFDIPNYVYGIDQLHQAKEEAKAGDKQIVFLYSNKNTNCPRTARASIGIMQSFMNSSVILYISKEDWTRVPRIVRDAIKSPEAGRFIPKTVVLNSGMTEVISIIPYEKAVQ